MENIINSFEKYMGSGKDVNIRRSAWNTTAKLLIEKTLEKIKETYALDAYVQSYGVVNKEAVNLCLNKIHSRISHDIHSAIKAFIKEPGYIIFTQSNNGLVKIIVSLPFIENITEKTSRKLLGTMEPDEISTDVINEYVGDFFDLLSIWENGVEQVSSWREYVTQY